MTVTLPDNAQFVPDEKGLDHVIDTIAQARRRILLVGGGAIAAGAHAEVQALAEQLQIPVLTTVDGRGVMPEDHPLCIGNYYNSAGMYKAIADADLTLAIGTKFAVGVDGQFAAQTPPGKLVHIDIDSNMIGRTHHAHVGLVADARMALLGINQRIPELQANDAQFSDKILHAGEGIRQAMRGRLGTDWPQVMDCIPREAAERIGVCS